MSLTTNQGVSIRKVAHSEGEVHAVMGDAMRFIATAAHSDGAYALSEIEVRPGSGAPPHIHHNEDEAFYVLEGSFTISADDDTYVLSKGDFVHVKRGLVRGYKNHTDQVGRLLIFHSPGAASDFYIGMGKLPVPPRMEDMLALGEKYGIEIVAPLT